MSTDLITYFSQRFIRENETTGTVGPFLTLSRETGCNATALARDLVREFRKRGTIWHFVNKEVLEQSARQLQLDQYKLEHKLMPRHKSYLDDIVLAFGERYYKNEKKVHDTIAAVIRHYAEKGKIIIVGRAGVAILNNMENGLHIRLEAPLEWRVQAFMKRKMYSEYDARHYVNEMDNKRRLMLEQFEKKPFEEINFDLRINTARFSQKETIELIIKAMEQKGLIG